MDGFWFSNYLFYCLFLFPFFRIFVVLNFEFLFYFNSLVTMFFFFFVVHSFNLSHYAYFAFLSSLKVDKCRFLSILWMDFDHFSLFYIPFAQIFHRPVGLLTCPILEVAPNLHIAVLHPIRYLLSFELLNAMMSWFFINTW